MNRDATPHRVAVARAIFEACLSYIVGDRKDIGYDDLYGNEQSDLLDAADAVLHAIPNRVPPLPPADMPNVYVEKGGFGGGRTESRPHGGEEADDDSDGPMDYDEHYSLQEQRHVEADATRNRVPTEDELAEVMAACWDNPGFRSNREANGYPKMAKALRAYLLERAT